MPLFAKTKTNDKQLNHKSNGVSKKAKDTREELQKPQNAAEKPGIFKRFVSWVKSVFTKEPNLEPGATQSGNISAGSSGVSRADVNNTLSPDITGKPLLPNLTKNSISSDSGTAASDSDFGENAERSENAENAPVKLPEFTPGVNITRDLSIVSGTTEKVTVKELEFETFLISKNIFTQSGTVKVLGKNVNWSADQKISLVFDKKSQENTKTAPAQDKEQTSSVQTEKPADGEQTSPVQTEKSADGEQTSPVQTEKPADEEQTSPVQTEKPADEEQTSPVKTEKPADEEQTSPVQTEKPADEKEKAPEQDEKEASSAQENGTYFGSGEITFSADGLSCQNKLNIKSEILIIDNEVSYRINGGLVYSQDGIKIALGKEFKSLDEFRMTEVTLLSYSPDSDPPMLGDVTVGVDGFKGSALKNIAWFPSELFNGVKPPKLKLAVNKNKLGLSLDEAENIKLSAGIKNVVEVKAEKPVKAEVLASGEIKYCFSGSGFMSLLGKPSNLKFDLTAFNITMGQGLTGMDIPEFDLDIGDVKLKKISLGFKDDSSGGIEVGELGYKGLRIDNVRGKFDDSGITAGADSFRFPIGNTALSGTLKDISWKKNAKTFTVSKFELKADSFSPGKNITVNDTGMEFSLTDKGFAFKASGTFSAEAVGNDCFSVSADKLAAEFSLSEQDKEKPKLAAKLDGAIKFTVGKDQPAEITAGNISYEDGEFAVESIELKAQLKNLISDKFSGSASLTANELKFSDKAELGSLKAVLENLTYKGKKLVTNAKAEIFLKEGTGEAAGVDDNSELDVGKDKGILKDASLSIYLLKDKKGAQLSAGGIGLDYEYLSVSFGKLEAGFFTTGGENEITAGSAELKSGRKLNELLKTDSFGLTASDCGISSDGVRIGEISANVEGLKFGEALTVSNLNAQLKFDKEKAFQGFEGSASATLGNISVSELGISVTKDGDKLTTALKAKEIACKEDLLGLKITNVEGSYSDGRVTVASAKLSFTVYGTNVTGELKNLSWSKSEDFSVEEMTVQADKIEVNDSLSIEQGKLTASIKDKKFSLGAEAVFNIGEISGGFVKVDATELSISMSMSGGNSNFSAGGAVKGTIGVTLGDGIAVGRATDIQYEDGEFSVGEFSLGTDLSKLSGSLGGAGAVSVSSLKFKKGAAPSLGSATLSVSGVTYNSKPFMNSLTVGLILDSSVQPDKKNAANTAEASLGLDGGVDGVLGNIDIWVYLTDAYKGVKMNADTLKITAGNFRFDFNKFSGEFGSDGCKMTLGGFSMTTDIASSLGIENLNFTAKDVAVNDNKFTVGSISAAADGVVDVYGFKISNVTAGVSFDDKWSLKELSLGGDLNSGNSVSVSGFTVKYSGENKEGEVSAAKVTYKELTIETLKGTLGSSGITAGAEKFEFPVNKQTISGTLQGFKWKPGGSFTVSKFQVTANTLSFGELVTVDGASIDFSLTEDEFSFVAEGTVTLKKIETGMLTVNAEALKLRFSMGDKRGGKTKDAKSDKSAVSASVEGTIGFSVGKESAVEASAENISYEGEKFTVGTLELSTDFTKLLSGSFSGTAQLTAEGLTFGKGVDLAALTVLAKDFSFGGKTLLKSARARIFFKENSGDPVKAGDDASLAAGEDTGILKGASISIYLLKDKKGIELAADSLDYSFRYVSVSLEKIGGALFGTGEVNISSEKAEIRSKDELNSLIGAESLDLTVSGCKISSKGVEIGKVTAELKKLAVANALTLDGSAELEFDGSKKISKFEAAASAKLGNSISITGLSLKIAENGTELKANEIDCGEALKSLKINAVSGSFSKENVTVSSESISFKLAEKEFTGSLENLSWSREDNFSVDKITVQSGKIDITDGISVEGGEITASVKNKSFSVTAKAKLAIDDLKNGVIKLSKTELEFGLNISDEKNDDGSKLKIGGSAKGSVAVEIGDGIASAVVENIEYNDGEFSLGSFGAKADLSKFGSDMLGGSGEVFVNSLKFKKGEAPTVGSVGMKLSGLSYNGKTLINDLSVNIILDSSVQPEKTGEETAKADKAELSLSGLSGMLNGLEISVYLTEGFKGVQLDADNFLVKPKSFELMFDKFSGKFGSEKGSAVCDMKLGGLKINSDLSENKIAQYLGVENLKFSAENASVENNKLKLGKIAVEVEGKVSVCGFDFNDVRLDAEFSDDMELKTMTVGGTLSYGKYVSGSAEFEISGDGVKLKDIKKLSLSYGCFSGGLNSIIIDSDKEKTFTLEDISLRKESGGESSGVFAESMSGTLMSKFIDTVPNIEIHLKKLAVNNGKIEKPSLDDISVTKFEKEFNLFKGVSGKIMYTGGENGEFSIDGKGGFSLSDGDQAKQFTFLTLPAPLLPPVLTANFSLGLLVKLKAEASFCAKAARDDKNLNFNTAINAHADAEFGIFASASLSANALLVSLEGGLTGEAAAKANFDLNGKLNIVYDNSAKFLEAFSVVKDNTSLGFEAGVSVDIALKLFGKIGGLPAIFSKKSLSHSWVLGKYTLAGLNIKGAVAYDYEAGKYQLSAEPTVTNAKGIAAYSPKVTSEKIAEFGNSLSDLQSSMKSINSLLERVRNGVSPDSTDTIAGTAEEDFGNELQGGKDKLTEEIKKRIDNLFRESKNNSLKCHILMTDLAKMIGENADKLTENQRNVEALERIIGESATALELTGFKADGELTAEDYLKFIDGLKELKADEERLSKLAELEPAAVVNMFKAFKLNRSKKWDDIHDQTEELTAEQTVNEVEEPVYSSRIKPGVYATAMNELDSILKKRQEELKKNEERVAASKVLIKNLQEQLERVDKEESAEILVLKKDALRIYMKLAKAKIIDLSDEKYDEYYKQVDEVITSDYLTQAYHVRMEEEEQITKNHWKPAKHKKAMDDAKNRYFNGLLAHYNEMNTDIMNRQVMLNARKTRLQSDIGSAETQRDESIAAVEHLKSQMMESGDISTTMTGFQEFVSAEHRGAAGALETAQKKYGLTADDKKPGPGLSAEEKEKRRENVINIIDMLINEAAHDNLKNFESSRHTERIKVLRERSGIVDVNMRGFGLPERRRSNAAFNTMKSDNEKFQKMKQQLTETYDKITGFHDVMRQVLNSWQEVNGIKFKGMTLASEFIEGSVQTLNLVDEVEKIKKNSISDEDLNKITQEVKSLNIAQEQPSAQQAQPGQPGEAERLGV